jgi:adhesin/invasin
VSLTVSPSVFSVVSSELSVEQGGSDDLSFTVFDGRGEPASGVLVALSSPTAGISLPSSVVTDGSGSATVEVSVSAAALPGAATVVLSAGAGSLTRTFEVVSGVSSVDVPASAVPVAQRGVKSVTVTARNAQGAPVAARVLTLSTPAGIYAPATVYTLADGTATFTVSAAEDRLLGAVSIGVSYQGVLLGAVPLTVLPGVASIEVSGSLVASGTATVEIFVKNSVGLALAGRTVAVRAEDSRVSVSPSSTATDAAGVASFNVTSGPIPAGQYRFVATVDGRELAFEVGRS